MEPLGIPGRFNADACRAPVSRAKKIHWPFPDPADKTRSEDEQLHAFREIRDSLKAKLEAFARETGLA
jgi:arsenate reductase